MGIKYWEIWNEPDGDLMWCGGTLEDYLNLYRITATKIKETYPDLFVGGPAAAAAEETVVKPLLKMCAKENIPIDFFTWHGYGRRATQLPEKAKIVDEILADLGLRNTKNICDEWNYWPEGVFNTELTTVQSRDVMLRLKNEEGASFCVSSLIGLMDTGIDMTHYYDGQICATAFCGLFDSFGVPQKTFYAFKSLNYVVNFPERVVSDCKNEMYSIAGIDRENKEAAILLSRFDTNGYIIGEERKDVPLSLKNLPEEIKEYEIFLIDKNFEFISQGLRTIPNDKIINISLEKFATVLICLRKPSDLYRKKLLGKK